MRHGRKSSQTRFDGYKLSAAATNTSEPLITAVDVAPASETDGPQAKHLIDAQPEAGARSGCWATPPTATGRSAPNSPSVTSTCSPRSPRARSSRAAWASATSSSICDAGTVTCPAGHSVHDQHLADRVPRRELHRATARLPAEGRLLSRTRAPPDQPTEHEDLLIAARQALADPDTAEHLRRTRPRIERLLGLLAARYGARKSRYIGRAKARLQAAWAAALVNLNPIARHLNTPTT